MSKTILKIALDRLDRHSPFFMDAVTAPDGVELQPLEFGLVGPDAYRDGVTRVAAGTGVTLSGQRCSRYFGALSHVNNH